ncbi:rho guanine nucleotide exchange factor 11 isoform X2 [Aricia agestis]|uniref:rho guanine nucleotide exchange factor 11 isoform X2 n=1 Tax=Aricia agestis TaxID=91739 RepID=UPI001C2058AB|nr:rho guanine nucleotide exchange factor 11 isoform X2 [Aricia agestis]
MLGGTGGGGVATSPGADNLLTVTVARDEHGYGMKVSGDNPVYVQSVKEHGAAWRAGLRSGDRILRVDSVPVHHHTHQQVVQLIRANPSPVLTVQQNSSRHKTPITAPQPVNPEKQRQLEATKAHTFRMMLDQEQKYIRDLRNELLKVPDVRKQAELAAAEQRCCNLQTRIDSILAAQPEAKPATPKMPRAEKNAQNTSFLSGLPRSLSNLTGQSLRNLRQRKDQPLIRQNSEESKKRHNNTVPMVPTTCLDNTPPPLPPRSERFNSPPLPLKPSTSRVREMRRSSHSLDELEPQPNSIAMQLSYPLVNVPPPPLQTDNRSGLPILHVRSQSSPEQLDDLTRSVGERPPGTPPPPYPHQPCGDPQRAIISMEEDDSPASDNSTYSGLFSNLRSVRDSRARMAVLINWLLGERRSACAALLLVLTDGYRAAAGVPLITLRRWAYELQSTFLVPAAVLQLNGVDENMANEIDHVLVNEHDKEELLRNVFRKARRLAKDELARQLSDFQLKRRAGLGALYGPTDDVLKRCALDRQQEQIVVERLMTARLTALAAPPTQPADAHAALLAAVSAAALCLGCRPASVAAAVGGGARATFLQRDKPYKQRVKQLAKQHPQPFIVRGHHLQAQALTAANHCHHCGAVIAGIAPQAFVCTDCNLRVHRTCARAVEETCVLEHGDHGNRISRLMERMTPAPHPGLENDKKSRKSAGSGHFLNMERSFRKNEDIWDQPTASPVPGEPRREGSHEEPPAAEGEGEPDTKEPDKENEKSWRGATRGVNRAESCRERDAPRRGKHRNASDPNRLTAHPNHDLEPGAATAPSGSSSSSSLSSRSNESNTVPPDQASQSDWSEEEEPLAAQWSDSLPPAVRDALVLSARLRKRQEVIHELIVSEGSHVRWLKVLGVDFLKPLERQPTLLSAEELRALFPNLPSVRERHSRLYAELRSARESAPQHVVQIRPIADALLNTLGEAGYAACLSKFCQGQRMALDALKERRRKSKELQQFLAGREQLPRCGRLQLRDLLACVWQRLTKYQLLLEGIIKTVHEGTNDAEGDSDDAPEDAARLKAALAVAKEVLHSVDTAIRTAENEHRLRTIQSKLEIRVGTLERAEAEELRRTDLTQCRLRYEGELLLRADTKKTAVLALLLEDRLVLLQREGDKFVLRPVPTAAAGAQLLPVIKWDKVLFRPNAAVRNTFFLMNINGIQMHELSATTAAEYAIWVKHIQESPLARLAEVKSVAPPAPPPPEHHGTNVSRNPSDASEKSTTSTHSCEQEAATETEDRRDTEERERQKQDEEENEKGTEKGASSERDSEDKHTPTVGRISTHLESPATLESCTVTASVCTASRCVTPAERLRRLDAAVTRALRAKAAAAAEMLRVPVDQAEQLAEIAAEDTLRQLEAGGDRGPPDLHQLLLAAQAQANQLTEILNSALSVSEGAVVAARAGRCDRCCRRDARHRHSETRDVPESDSDETSGRLSGAPDDVADTTETDDATGNPDPNSDWARSSEEFSGAAGAGAAALAARLAGAAGGLQAVLGALLATLPALEAERTSLRQQLAVARERADRDYHMSETLPRGNMDQSIQEQPSHGG